MAVPMTLTPVCAIERCDTDNNHCWCSSRCGIQRHCDA